MVNINERKSDILRLVKALDITPAMYKNAFEKYHKIADFLAVNGIEADIYPQGSFALGTVIRPITKDPNAYYDLDFICQMPFTRNSNSAAETRIMVKDILEKSDLYGGKLTIYENCFTIEYAEINGVGFKVDIVPAVDESAEQKTMLKELSEYPELVDTAIAIPQVNKQPIFWPTNNPKGYKSWFDGINEPFKNENRQ